MPINGDKVLSYCTCIKYRGGGVDVRKYFLTYPILNTWRHVLSMGRGLTVRKLFLPTPCNCDNNVCNNPRGL
jgi:hypothetical protein